MDGAAPPRSETFPAPPSGARSRPWSGVEPAERLEQILDALADAVDAERELGVEAAEAEHTYRLAKSLALVSVGGANAQEREARAYLAMSEGAGEAMSPRQARDYWAALYRSGREKVAWLQTEARVAQTLKVDAREVGR